MMGMLTKSFSILAYRVASLQFFFSLYSLNSSNNLLFQDCCLTLYTYTWKLWAKENTEELNTIKLCLMRLLTYRVATRTKHQEMYQLDEKYRVLINTLKALPFTVH